MQIELVLAILVRKIKISYLKATPILISKTKICDLFAFCCIVELGESSEDKIFREDDCMSDCLAPIDAASIVHQMLIIPN